MGEFHFSKLISHNGLRRYACRQNLISDLDREIGKQQIRIQKSLHTFLKTSPSGFKLCRGFICVVSFNMRLIRPKKHRPFRIVASHSVYDQIKLKRNTYIYIYIFVVQRENTSRNTVARKVYSKSRRLVRSLRLSHHHR